MSDRFFSVPIIQTTGSNAGAAGQVGTVLASKQYINASIIAPRSGILKVSVVVSGDLPNPAVNIALAMVKGYSNFPEKWDYIDTRQSIPITVPNTYIRHIFFQNLSISEGEFIGIRVQNYEENYMLNVAAVYLEY
ncbi:MAG: hypothetical protein EAX95_02915 [Candidatus Thorarchaeota archaeon]|nr:hypothetical protein [Candidatus Thorarchaeota archaeon]